MVRRHLLTRAQETPHRRELCWSSYWGVQKSGACPFFSEFKSINVELFFIEVFPPCLITHSSRSNHELKTARRVYLSISLTIVMISLLSSSRVVQWKVVSFLWGNRRGRSRLEQGLCYKLDGASA
jgi:hypothetical protein